MQSFVFTSDITSLRGDDAVVMEVPQGLADKKALLSWYAKALAFPGYFDFNWDAFGECMRDLSWIKERRLVLYHRSIPLESSLRDQTIYVEVLASAVRNWKAGEEHEVVVAFDPECELGLKAIKRAP